MEERSFPLKMKSPENYPLNEKQKKRCRNYRKVCSKLWIKIDSSVRILGISEFLENRKVSRRQSSLQKKKIKPEINEEHCMSMTREFERKTSSHFSASWRSSRSSTPGTATWTVAFLKKVGLPRVFQRTTKTGDGQYYSGRPKNCYGPQVQN